MRRLRDLARGRLDGELITQEVSRGRAADRGVRAPFFSRARGARIAPVGRELLASGVRVRACARSLSFFVEIQWMQSDFSGAGANAGHPALATPAHNTTRTACKSAISVGDCVCGERRGNSIDLLKNASASGGKSGLRSTSPVLPLISPFSLFLLRQLLPTASEDAAAAAGPAAPRSPRLV